MAFDFESLPTLLWGPDNMHYVMFHRISNEGFAALLWVSKWTMKHMSNLLDNDILSEITSLRLSPH